MTLFTLSVLGSLDCVPESSGNVDPKMICLVFQSGKEKTEKLFAWDLSVALGQASCWKRLENSRVFINDWCV